MELNNELNEVFREVFDDSSLEVTAETVASDVDGWDSVSHISLIVAIEEKFSVRFTPREVASLSNVGDLMNLINQKRQ